MSPSCKIQMQPDCFYGGLIAEIIAETLGLFLNEECVFFGILYRIKKTAEVLCFKYLHVIVRNGGWHFREVVGASLRLPGDGRGWGVDLERRGLEEEGKLSTAMPP